MALKSISIADATNAKNQIVQRAMNVLLFPQHITELPQNRKSAQDPRQQWPQGGNEEIKYFPKVSFPHCKFTSPKN